MALTATVTPGKTFVAAELVTNSKLNQLAAPSVSIAGTADTTQISNDSVTAAKAAFGPWFYGVGGGSATAHTVTIAGHTLAAYVDGLILRYRVGSGNDSVTDQAGVTLTSSGTTATCTTPSAHALAIGDKVMVYDATQDDYNGTFQVASVGSATTFTYVFAGSATSPATGTINVRYSAVGGEGSFIQTSGVTVDVAGLGAKNLFGPAGTRLMPGEIITGEIIEILYNGTSDWFEILSRETASEVIRAVDNSATANAYAAQATDGRTTLLVNNTLLVCRMALGNTATATLTFGSLSGTIRKNGLTALTSGDIVGGQWCQFIWDGTYWQMLSPAVPASARATVPVRQTVLSCSVGSTGLPNFLAHGSGTTVSTQNCTTTPLVVAFAYGSDDSGAVDYVTRISTNAANWTGLGGTTTYYLYVDRSVSTGAITYGITTNQPTYTATSTVASGAGFHTYLINTGFMYEGSATSTAIQRVFVGEATTSAGAVTSVTPYMPRGEFQSGTLQAITALITTQVFTDIHQLGLAPRLVRCVLVDQNNNLGFTAGDEINVENLYNSTAVYHFGSSWSTPTQCGWPYSATSFGAGYLLNKSTGALSAIALAGDFKIRFYAWRGW
jgi:hypothetical protein